MFPALNEERRLLAHHKVQVSLTDQICTNVACATHFGKPISLVKLDKLHSHHLSGTKKCHCEKPVRTRHSWKINLCVEHIHTLCECSVWTEQIA